VINAKTCDISEVLKSYWTRTQRCLSNLAYTVD